MARRGKAREDPAASEKVDESAWEDWRTLRAEMGRRLGGRDATGVSDAEVLAAARKAAKRRP